MHPGCKTHIMIYQVFSIELSFVPFDFILNTDPLQICDLDPMNEMAKMVFKTSHEFQPKLYFEVTAIHNSNLIDPSKYWENRISISFQNLIDFISDIFVQLCWLCDRPPLLPYRVFSSETRGHFDVPKMFNYTSLWSGSPTGSTVGLNDYISNDCHSQTKDLTVGMYRCFLFKGFHFLVMHFSFSISLLALGCLFCWLIWPAITKMQYSIMVKRVKAPILKPRKSAKIKTAP